MRVGLISYRAAEHDAVGNHLWEKLAFFLERAAEVRVFIEDGDRLQARLRPHTRIVEQVQQHGPIWEYLADSDLVMVDYGHYYELLHYVPLLAGGKPRVVIDYHGVTPPSLGPGAQRDMLEKGAAWRGLAWDADAVVVHSDFTRDELRDATDLPADRIAKLPLVVDDLHFTDSTVEPEAPARVFGLADDARILLYVGRLAANKRLPVLIDAAARLQDRHLPVHVVIVGDERDVYAVEKQACLDLAERLGIKERVHFLGQLDDDALARAYRTADVLVIPSVHEGFCLPVMEAMASGLPVLAARAGALPETVGDAGLTFTPEDADDLAAQVRRILHSPNPHSTIRNPQSSTEWDAHHEVMGKGTQTRPSPREERAALPSHGKEALRVAFVSFRFGADIVGGAETSLRTMALALRDAGHHIEVFTTCTRAEGHWRNELPAGTAPEDGLLVHRFPIDAHDRVRHLDSVRLVLEADGHVSPDAAQEYVKHSIHSVALIEALAKRRDDFDAIVTGPYLFGLTLDVARRFAERSLLVPCFHDEAMARLRLWPVAYGGVAGILYHSAEEQHYAQTRLGVNHAHTLVIGTFLKAAAAVVPGETAKTSSASPPMLVYCGRYSKQKELPRLLEYAGRYERMHARRFQWCFLGQGEVALPCAPWARDLGRVDEATKRRVLREAAALVQLSTKESLSLVALEAWAEGTPVIGETRCAVLAGNIARARGGAVVDDYESFAQVLDDLWQHPEVWRERGRLGQQYVWRHYGDRVAFTARLEEAVRGVSVAVAEHMRHRGRARATICRREAWRARFAGLIEQVLDAAPRPWRQVVAVRPVQERCVVAADAAFFFLAVQVVNTGTRAAPAEGPARVVVHARVHDDNGEPITNVVTTSLPELLVPGQVVSAAVKVAVPGRPGEYRVHVWAAPANLPPADRFACAEDFARLAQSVHLTVEREGGLAIGPAGGPFLAQARKTLVEIQEKLCLPDDYLDVTEGRFARAKRWLKAKILGNFKRGYVDVLSRQQSQVNRRLFAAIQQLAEFCATLDHMMRQGQSLGEAAELKATGLEKRRTRVGQDSNPVRSTHEE